MTNYINELTKTIKSIKQKDTDNLANTIKFANKVFIIGNGGSQSTAEHFATDLIKYCGKFVYTFSNSCLFSMAANDFSFEHSFEWLITNLSTPNDMIVGISTSGKSSNIIRALSGKMFLNTALITGLNGKEIAKEFDSSIVINSSNTQIIEDVSLIICHIVSMKLKKEYK
jgi:D-sedoheptulose 7-phosphate isomerase